jgi:hypothetical protein
MSHLSSGRSVRRTTPRDDERRHRLPRWIQTSFPAQPKNKDNATTNVKVTVFARSTPRSELRPWIILGREVGIRPAGKCAS